MSEEQGTERHQWTKDLLSPFGQPFVPTHYEVRALHMAEEEEIDLSSQATVTSGHEHIPDGNIYVVWNPPRSGEWRVRFHVFAPYALSITSWLSVRTVPTRPPGSVPPTP